MKVIDKSNREFLLEIMKLPMDIRKYDLDEQYYFIHQVLEILKRSIFMDDTVIEHNKYIPSKRQEATWQNALLEFQRKDYLSAYFEIIDFIDDYGNRENRNFFEEEMNNIRSILIGIDKKIVESINLSEAYKKIINRLNINSDFNVWIGEGSVAPMNRNENYKGFTLYDNVLNVEWLGNNKIIKDDNVITKIKEVIIKYKNELYDFSKRQEDENGEFPAGELIIGTYNDECKGSVDSLNFSVCNRFNHKELNNFYEQFRTDLFNIIENNVFNNKQHKGKVTDNINTNDSKGINEKYNGISGIISIKNIIGSLPEQNNETKSSTNNGINIILPKEYQLMKSMPDDPENSVVYGKQTSNAICMAMLYYINKNDAMPYNNKEIIDGIHNTLKENQGLIEVNSGITKNNKKYVYSIVKTRKEPSGIQYTLTLQIEMQEGVLNIQAFFDEIGVTGQRESIIMAKMINEGKINPINPNEMNEWMKDPYDETYNKGLRMNLAEKEEYDAAFPEHPLSEARNFVKIIIEKN